MKTSSDQNTKTPEPQTTTTLLRPWARYLGGLTSMLAVYGYCVMQGVADALNIEGGNLWGTPGDVLHYAFLGIVAALHRLPDPNNFDWLAKIIRHWHFWLMALTVMVLAWAMFRMDKSPEAYAKRNDRLKNNRLTYWMQKKIRNMAVWQWAAVIASPWTVLVALLMAWFSLLMTAGALLVFGLIGINSGLAHVADHKPDNPYCVTAPSPQDKSAQAVRCVRVRWQADGQTHSETGILIASTSSYALLARPDTPQGLRVPLSGQTILEVVDSLKTAPPPAPSANPPVSATKPTPLPPSRSDTSAYPRAGA